MTTKTSNINTAYLETSKGLKLHLHKKPNIITHSKELKPKGYRGVTEAQNARGWKAPWKGHQIQSLCQSRST